MVKPHLRTHNQWGWQGLKVIIANFEGRVIGQQIVVVVVEVQRVRGLSSKHAILRRSNYCPRDELIGDRKEGGDLQDLGQQMNHVGDSIRFFPLAAGSSCVTGSWSLCLFLFKNRIWIGLSLSFGESRSVQRLSLDISSAGCRISCQSSVCPYLWVVNYLLDQLTEARERKREGERERRSLSNKILLFEGRPPITYWVLVSDWWSTEWTSHLCTIHNPLSQLSRLQWQEINRLRHFIMWSSHSPLFSSSSS